MRTTDLGMWKRFSRNSGIQLSHTHTREHMMGSAHISEADNHNQDHTISAPEFSIKSHIEIISDKLGQRRFTNS